jgi:hypothetical protein
MTFQQRVDAIIYLGQQMGQLEQQKPELLQKAYAYNNWFTPENISLACRSWEMQLQADAVTQFVKGYDIPVAEPKTIAIITAGNIPFVGLHDLICVVLSGHRALLKLSEDDTVLMKAIVEVLHDFQPEMKDCIYISEDRLPKEFDAVIATGSNNTNRYFEYYFRNKKSLLRGSRHSVAVIKGNESDEDMQRLADDVFMYFGLGCRNVSKVYIPKGFDFAKLYENTHHYDHLIHHHKYANNYTYHKAILMMDRTPILDNNLLLMKEDAGMSSPLSMLYYEYYDNLDKVVEKIEADKEHIQCVVSAIDKDGWQPLGRAQFPSLFDFADGVDTMQFLCNV